jgi:hypothetical protein
MLARALLQMAKQRDGPCVYRQRQKSFSHEPSTPKMVAENCVSSSLRLAAAGSIHFRRPQLIAFLGKYEVGS